MPSRVWPFVSLLFASAALATGPQSWQARSPDGHLILNVDTDTAGQLRYTVHRDDATIALPPAKLGLTVDGVDLGTSAALGEARPTRAHDAFAVRGVHAKADLDYTEAFLPVHGGAAVDWTLDVRVYDDAVAFRYVVPGPGKHRVADEATEWRLPLGSRLWSQSHAPAGKSFDGNEDYETRYTAGGRKRGDLIAAPALLQLPNDAGYALITEANLVHYTDTALTVLGEGGFRATYSDDADGFDVTGPVTTPWRVTVLAKDLTALVNTDVIRSLCPPPPAELADADWIKPGRAAWHWRVTGHPKFADQHQWVDSAAALGFEYYLVDDGWKAWKDGDRTAWPMIKTVADYAKTKNVALWAWVEAKDVKTADQRSDYFAKANAAGLVGLKIDFPKASTPEWVDWYEDTLADLAKAHLMVDFHGALKPTGRDRTWPNELTREAVGGREQGKLPGVHDTTLPFLRYVQGNADYTPTEFRAKELHGNTVAKELAQAVVYTSPLLCYSGDPKTYLDSPALDVLKAIPSTWDQTLVLPGSKVGEVAAFARRKGDAWFVGVVNGDTAAVLPVALKFLGDGPYQAVLLGDTAGQPAAFDRQGKTVTRDDTLTATLAKDGGFVAMFTPVRP